MLEELIFVCKREKRGGLQPEKLSTDKIGLIGETIASVLAGKYLHKKHLTRSMLEAYNETPIFIPMDIMENVVKLLAQKLSGS